MMYALLGFPWYGWTFALGLVGLLWWASIVAKKGQARAAENERGQQMFPVTPKVKISDEDQRDLNIGAFLSAMWWFPVNTLETNATKAKMQNVMAESWDVKSNAEAKSTLQWLLDQGHRGGFDAVLRVAGPDPSRAGNERLEEALGEGASLTLAEPRDNLVASYEELSRRGFIETTDDIDRGTAAWDYSRAVTVARFCHTAGYLSDDEAWHFIREAGRRSREEFSSWREFHKSYIVGRAIWNGPSQLEDPEMNEVFEAVATGAKSPWQQVSWS